MSVGDGQGEMKVERDIKMDHFPLLTCCLSCLPQLLIMFKGLFSDVNSYLPLAVDIHTVESSHPRAQESNQDDYVLLAASLSSCAARLQSAPWEGNSCWKDLQQVESMGVSHQWFSAFLDLKHALLHARLPLENASS